MDLVRNRIFENMFKTLKCLELSRNLLIMEENNELASNAVFLILISLHPEVVNLQYF